MVKMFVVSEYSLHPPEPWEGRSKIAGGPLYDLARVQKLAEDEHALQTWTEKCRKDVRKWFDDDLERVTGLLLSLKPQDYKNSEWCENGKGAIAACDAYTVNAVETAPATGRSVRMAYFLKFAVSKTGALVLIVSCHA